MLLVIPHDPARMGATFVSPILASNKLICCRTRPHNRDAVAFSFCDARTRGHHKTRRKTLEVRCYIARKLRKELRTNYFHYERRKENIKCDRPLLGASCPSGFCCTAAQTALCRRRSEWVSVVSSTLELMHQYTNL